MLAKVLQDDEVVVATAGQKPGAEVGLAGVGGEKFQAGPLVEETMRFAVWAAGVVVFGGGDLFEDDGWRIASQGWLKLAAQHHIFAAQRLRVGQFYDAPGFFCQYLFRKREEVVFVCHNLPCLLGKL